jgi:starvation-inducible DNA-binding protein
MRAKASVKEAGKQETAEQMVQTTVNDYTQMIGELKEGMDLAKSAKDQVTSDMLLAIHSSLEKHVWMLKSFMGK